MFYKTCSFVRKNVDLFYFIIFSVLCLFMYILHMPLLEVMNINKSSIFKNVSNLINVLICL